MSESSSSSSVLSSSSPNQECYIVVFASHFDDGSVVYNNKVLKTPKAAEKYLRFILIALINNFRTNYTADENKEDGSITLIEPNPLTGAPSHMIELVTSSSGPVKAPLTLLERIIDFIYIENTHVTHNWVIERMDIVDDEDQYWIHLPKTHSPVHMNPKSLCDDPIDEDRDEYEKQTNKKQKVIFQSRIGDDGKFTLNNAIVSESTGKPLLHDIEDRDSKKRF